MDHEQITWSVAGDRSARDGLMTFELVLVEKEILADWRGWARACAAICRGAANNLQAGSGLGNS